MTASDAPTTRRGLREQAATADPDAVDLDGFPDLDPLDLPGTAALTWVVAGEPARPLTDSEVRAAAYPYVPVGPELLPSRSRSFWRPAVVVPIGVVLVALTAYVLATLLWPLQAIVPAMTTSPLPPVSAPASAPAWPGVGSAAVSITGLPGVPASNEDTESIASIAKLATALLVVDRLPLAPGESGPEYAMTDADRAAYRAARDNGESALDVPVGGTLSELQLLEGMLIGSANNYADLLAAKLWPSDAAFAEDARTWLAANGIGGVTIVEPTGLDAANRATAASLLPLASRALADPVLATIVATRSVEIPGAGLVKNTNGLLADPGIVGVKTGTLDAYNIVAAKDVAAGGTSVRVLAATLGQPDDATRLAATRAIFDSVERELAPLRVVPTGTVVGVLDTPWGDRTDIVTATDADVVLWNGATAQTSTVFALGEARTAGQDVGTLTATGSLGTATTALRLASDLTDPDPFWRLTHPLEVFGLAR